SKSSEPLVANLTVEALVVNGSAKRGESLVAVGQELLPLDVALNAARRGPTPLLLSALTTLPYRKALPSPTPPKRPFPDIARKNTLEGASRPCVEPPQKPKERKDPPKNYIPDLITFACLTDVTIASAPKASLFDRSVERKLDLNMGSSSSKWIPLIREG